MSKELQGQEQLGTIITKEKDQEQINIIDMKLPKVEKTGKVSKQLNKTGRSSCVFTRKSSKSRRWQDGSCRPG